MRNRRLVAAVVLCVTSIASCESFTEVLGPTPYVASATGAQVKPTVVTTTATGTFSGSLHPTRGTFAYTFAWKDLSGVAISAHLHGPSDKDDVADPLVDFSALPGGGGGSSFDTGATGAATGTLDLTMAITPAVSGDSLRKLLTAGLVYVDVHTVANPDGEIRGQIRSQ